MKKFYFLIVWLLTILNLYAIESLQMSEVGSVKIVSTSCVNSNCTISLNSGSQLYFQIKNNTNKNLVLTKFELIKTYNNKDVIESTTTDINLLGGSNFIKDETTSLGYETVSNKIANYWTGKYYITNLDTGEKFTNSLRWDNYLTTNSVVAIDITENIINVATVTEFRAALITAANDNKDTIISLSDGNYTTTEDNLGQFKYSTSQNYTLKIKGSNRDNVILSGEDTHRVLQLNGGKEFYLENITVQKGYVNGKGGGVYANKNTYLNYVTIKENRTSDNSFNDGGGLYIHDSYKANLWVNNSIIENNVGVFGGGFYTYNTEIRNSIIKGNIANHSGGGFEASHTQIYNSIVVNNKSEASKYNSGAFSSSFSTSIVNSLIANNDTGIGIEYNNNHYVVNSIFSNNGEFNIKDNSSASIYIINSYILGNLSITHFDTNLITSGNLGFVDEENDNYRLTKDSILLDAGTIEYEAVDIPLIDKDGYKRVSGANIDIGPYEFSSTQPTLYSFNYTGVAEEISELTFSVSYTFEKGRTLSNIVYDYQNNGSWTSLNKHTFNKAGTYTIHVKVTDSSGEYSIATKTITIVELPFSEMSDEQKLLKAIDPQYYDEVIQILNNKSDNINSITTNIIESMQSGWTLSGTNSSITDMSIFDNTSIIWIYKNNSWSAYSSNETIIQNIKNANISLINSIPANSGIWIYK